MQRSVQQQNAATKADIERTAAANAATSAWLCTILRSHQLEPSSGLLVRLSEIPEQEGNLVAGVWLNERLEFWEFEAVISRASGELLALERFADATVSYPVVAHAPATGSSFGYLACQVLRETRGA